MSGSAVESVVGGMLALCLCAACSGGRGDTMDGAVDAGADASVDASPESGADASVDAPFSPAPPDIPWLDSDGGVHLDVVPPQLTPCPGGWREIVDADGPTTCDPWPATGHIECPLGQVHLLGTTACAPVGAACPMGDWSDALPNDGSVLYVRPGLVAGDGTRALPYGSISEAVGHARAGQKVALAPANYDEVVDVPAGVSIQGACAEATSIGGVTATSDTPRVSVRGLGAGLHDLRVGPTAGVGILVTGRSASLELGGVVVTAATGTGIAIEDRASVSATRSSVEDTALSPTGAASAGLMMVGGSQADVREAMFVRNRGGGIRVQGVGSSLTLSRCAILASEPAAAGLGGAGLDVSAGAEARVDTVVAEGNHMAAMHVTGSATLSVESAVLGPTLMRVFDAAQGVGVLANAGGQASLSRVQVRDAESSGLVAGEAGSRVEGTDVIVRPTAGCELGVSGGVAAGAGAGATLSLTRALLWGSHLVRVAVRGVGSEVTLREVTVGDCHGATVFSPGYGAFAVEGATLDIERAEFIGSGGFAILASDDGSSAVLTDVVVEGGLEGVGLGMGEGSGGAGVAAQAGGWLRVTRVLFQRNFEVNMAAHSPGSRLEAADVWLRDGIGRLTNGRLGRGVEVGGGATAALSRVRIENLRELGIGAFSPGSEVTLHDVHISATRRSCSDDTCIEPIGGVGLGGYAGAAVHMTDFVLETGDLCGVQLASDASVDLSRGVISGNEIGACVQVDGYDVTRLTQDVNYVDNRSRDVEATHFPEPMAATLPMLP